jgi:hypothetical protein
MYSKYFVVPMNDCLGLTAALYGRCSVIVCVSGVCPDHRDDVTHLPKPFTYLVRRTVCTKYLNFESAFLVL